MKGHRVRRVLDERGIKYGWLARKMGVSYAMISRLLSGKRKWQDYQKQRAAQALGLPESALFFGTDCDQE
jgi:transcriptional regulator with XRE-family HTH domain